MLMIISSKDDAHIPFVAKHLKKDFCVLDAGDVLEGKGLTYRLDGDQVSIKYDSRTLYDIDAVWLRKPRNLKHDLRVPVDAGYADYCKDAVRLHICQLFALLEDALWVSDRYAIDRAENKMYQLQLARRVGFNVPETVITSSPADALEFVDSHISSLTKPLSRYSPVFAEQYYRVFFAQKLTSKDPAIYQGLHVAPSIFQQAIELGFDIRVTVVGDKVFTAKLLLEGVPDSSIRDWHIGHQKGSIRLEEYELPKDVAQRCVQLVKDMGLQFGALDFVQDQEGKIWFIEINPNGQWAFVEEETGQPIGKSVAALLEGRHVPSLQKYVAV